MSGHSGADICFLRTCLSADFIHAYVAVGNCMPYGLAEICNKIENYKELNHEPSAII